MKNNMLKLVLAIAIGSFSLASCGESKTHEAAEHGEHAHATKYQCPMDCENGKTYDEPGSCPVCGMDITEV